MSKLFPKDFVLWRPHLLLILIFLEVVFDCTGGSGRGLVEASKLAGYGDSCSEEIECHDAFECDKLRRECTCPNHITSKLVQFYDKKQGRCVSAVGKLCSLESEANDGLPKIDCVPYAECVRPKWARKLSTLFGVCKCAATFEETEDLLCKPEKVFQVGNGGPEMTMAQVGMNKEGLSSKTPVEGNMDEVVENGEKKSVPIKADVEDPNNDLVGHKDVKEGWIPVDTDSASHAVENVKWLIFLAVAFYTVLCSNLM